MNVTALNRAAKPAPAALPAKAQVLPLPRPARPMGALPGRLGRLMAERVAPPVVVLAVLLLLWQLALADGTSGLPAPLDVWQQSRDLILDPFFVFGSQDIGLGWRVLTSLERVGIGFGLAAVAGVMLGAAIGQSVWLMRGLDPIFQVLRTVPPLAWLPISLAAFMDSRPSAIFVIFITAIWPVIINTAAGVRAIPQDYRNVAAVLRLNQAEFFFKIMIPAAAPYIFSGLRIGVGLSWLAIVAAEMLTGGVGIGFWVWDEWNNLNVAHILIAIFVIGFVGLLLEQLLLLLARKVSHD